MIFSLLSSVWSQCDHRRWWKNSLWTPSADLWKKTKPLAVIHHKWLKSQHRLLENDLPAPRSVQSHLHPHIHLNHYLSPPQKLISLKMLYIYSISAPFGQSHHFLLLGSSSRRASRNKTLWILYVIGSWLSAAPAGSSTSVCLYRSWHRFTDWVRSVQHRCPHSGLCSPTSSLIIH